MKRIAIVFFIGLTYLLNSSVWAQSERKNDEKARWEKFRAEKIAFLTTSLDLTPEEAQVFWPVYNQMEKEKREIQNKRHCLDRQVFEASEATSDSEVIKLTREYVDNKKKEGEIDVKYNEEFLKILSPQKVLKLYKAEGAFRMHMFKKYRERHHGEDNRK